MSKLNGQKEAEMFRNGEPLTTKQAIKAQCFICNGEEDGSNEDCQGDSCPLKPFFKRWVLTKRGG